MVNFERLNLKRRILLQSLGELKNTEVDSLKKKTENGETVTIVVQAGLSQLMEIHL